MMTRQVSVKIGNPSMKRELRPGEIWRKPIASPPEDKVDHPYNYFLIVREAGKPNGVAIVQLDGIDDVPVLTRRTPENFVQEAVLVASGTWLKFDVMDPRV